MPEIKAKVECIDCINEAEFAYCQSCYEEKLEKEYERGKADGREETEEEFREADKQ